MTPDPGPPPRPRARLLPAFWFLLALVALGAIALVSLNSSPPILTGLPEGPAVAVARARVHGRLAVPTGELRFVSTLLGEGGAPNELLADGTARTLDAAGPGRPDDPRWLAVRAALELAAHRPGEAERLYRRAVDRAPSYGEARLGLGVTLALRAAAESDPERARGLRLRAVAQCAAVPEADPCYPAALYDRALLLVRVGRMDEARRHAEAYLARDPGSAWAATLTHELDAAPR